MFRSVVLVALVALLPACSIAFQGKPSRTQPVVAAGCSTSKVLPIIDTVGVVAGVATMAYGISDQEHKDWPMTAAVIATIPTLLYLASAGNGFRDAARRSTLVTRRASREGHGRVDFRQMTDDAMATIDECAGVGLEARLASYASVPMSIFPKDRTAARRACRRIRRPTRLLSVLMLRRPRNSRHVSERRKPATERRGGT